MKMYAKNWEFKEVEEQETHSLGTSYGLSITYTSIFTTFNSRDPLRQICFIYMLTDQETEA